MLQYVVVVVVVVVMHRYLLLTGFMRQYPLNKILRFTQMRTSIDLLDHCQ